MARVLYLLGALHVLMHVRLRNRAVVLMYHRVLNRDALEETFSHPGIIVEKPTFENHLRFLRKHFHVVSVSGFRDRMVSGQPFERRTCLITFDDGWEDNFTHAFPLLEEYDVPAVVFLTAGFIGTERQFWQESLARSLFTALERAQDGQSTRLREVLAKLGLNEDTLLPSDRARARIRENVSRAKNFSEKERRDLLDAAGELAGGHNGSAAHVDSFLSWAQVRKMAAGKIDFGSHTMNHELLTAIPFDRAQQEVMVSKQKIAKELSKDAIAFSYPSGNCNAQSQQIVADCGFQLAFSTKPGFVKCDDDRFAIRRINIHEGAAPTIPLLLATIVGIL